MTDPGMFSALSMTKVLNKMNITSLGFNETGKRARKGAVFIRTDPLLWTVMMDEGEAIFSSISLDSAVDFVKDILSPTIVPAKKSAAKSQTPKAAGETPMCPSVVSQLLGLTHISGGTATAVKSTYPSNHAFLLIFKMGSKDEPKNILG